LEINLKKYLISFGDDVYYKYQKLRLKKEADESNWFDKTIMISPEDLSLFFDQHKEFIQKNSKGHGFWIWKPYLILNQLNKINNGDFLFYMDSGSSVLPHKKNKFNEYLELLSNSEKPIITFADGPSLGSPPWYKEKLFQKMKVLKRFNLENNQEFLDSGQVEGGVFICRKCDFVMKFVQEWMNLVLEDNYSLVTDDDEFAQFPEFVEHRHDQSILSALCKMHKTIILGLDNCYGVGPFFSNRITDNGPKAKAPDNFRKEPDYDQIKHHNWPMYLRDNEIKEKTIEYIKNLIIVARPKLNFYNINYDLKNDFLKLIVSDIEKIQFNKGIYKIKITIDESFNYTSVNKEKLLGEFYCEFSIGDSHFFNFEILPNEVLFPEVLVPEKKLYKFEYIRTWESIS
jgi:hypothetical protein